MADLSREPQRRQRLESVSRETSASALKLANGIITDARRRVVAGLACRARRGTSGSLVSTTPSECALCSGWRRRCGCEGPAGTDVDRGSALLCSIPASCIYLLLRHRMPSTSGTVAGKWMQVVYYEPLGIFHPLANPTVIVPKYVCNNIHHEQGTLLIINLD